MKQRSHRLRVADHAAAVLRTLHPNIKRKLRAAFQALLADPYAGKALGDELSGLRSYRVSRFRVVYRLEQDRQVAIIAVGPRERIYEETYRQLQKERTQP
jgi:mRNA interferase RelE/StbE